MSPFLDIYGNELDSQTFSRAYPFVKISQLLINPVASKADLVLRRPRDALRTLNFKVLGTAASMAGVSSAASFRFFWEPNFARVI